MGQEARPGEHVAPRQVGGPGDPDAKRRADDGGDGRREEPERRPVEGQPVVLAGDTERLLSRPGPRAQKTRVVEAPAFAHRVEAAGRLQGADEDGARTPFLLADEVRHQCTPYDR